jgi:PAS domain S-box-containing protein
VGRRVNGFLHRESPVVEAKAVLAAALGRAEEAREAQRFKVLASSSPDLLIVIDEDGTYLDVFSADESLLYSKPERLRGRKISELFPPELAEPLYSLIVRATRGQMGGMIEYPLEVLGGKRWFEGRAAPAGMEPDGKRIAMYEARDITERKTSEAALRDALDEKNMLLRELQHRVKNNLAMISSLVSLETDRLEREEDRDAFERVQDRIRAMALIYDLLYRSESVNDVDLAAYLKRLLESFGESYLGGPEAAVELVDELEPARLDLKRAVPLGIIVTELLTNALKYAFPGGRKGRIALSLRVESGEAIVAVEDDGVGLSEVPHDEGATGTGVKLTGLFADQIGGRLSRGPGKDGSGLRCELALSLEPKEA